MKPILFALVMTATASVAAGQSSAPFSAVLPDSLGPLARALSESGVGHLGSSAIRGGRTQQPDVPAAGTETGHLALWDVLAVRAAFGTIAGRARGYCKGGTFDIGPVFGHVVLTGLFVILPSSETRHPPTQTSDPVWDAALMGAGVGALYGFLWAHDCDSEAGDLSDRAPRGRMTATGLAVLGGTSLVLDILHKKREGQPPSTVGVQISPAIRPAGLAVSISSRF